MKNILTRLKMEEKGQAFILALILLAVGGLIIVPLLGFMGTGLMAARLIEQKVDETYAADAGIEDAIYNIITSGAPQSGALDSLSINDTHTYSLTEVVNGQTVSVTVTKLSLIASFVDDSEYKIGQPHEGWVTFDAPIKTIQTAEFVEYEATADFGYVGGGNRTIESIGFLFSTYPGDGLIDGPYDPYYTEVISDVDLEAGSPELATASGAFAFIWKWQNNKGPTFNSGDTGSLSFKFRIMDPDWEYSNYFIWALFKEQDISYVTNNPGDYTWLIEATAGGTTVRSYVLEGVYGTGMITWEINPQQ